MNITRIIIVSLFMAIFMTGCVARRSYVSRAIKAQSGFKEIIKKHERPEGYMDVSLLPEIKALPLDEVALESYRVPDEKGVQDAFIYRIYMDRKNGRYWISQTDGYSGYGKHIFGPGRISWRREK